MSNDMFYTDGPLFTLPEHGREPALYDMIVHYYTSHGVTAASAITYANDYIEFLTKKYTITEN